MWSYMVISNCCRASVREMEITYSVQAEAFLENLAHAARGLAELQRRHAGGAMEGADEIGEIAKADVIGYIGHVPVILGQQPCRMPQPRAKQILMRSDTEHAREQPQEMERADAGFKRRILQGDVPMRMRVEPQRCFHRAAAVPRRDRGALAPVAADHL